MNHFPSLNRFPQESIKKRRVLWRRHNKSTCRRRTLLTFHHLLWTLWSWVHRWWKVFRRRDEARHGWTNRGLNLFFKRVFFLFLVFHDLSPSNQDVKERRAEIVWKEREKRHPPAIYSWAGWINLDAGGILFSLYGRVGRRWRTQES